MNFIKQLFNKTNNTLHEEMNQLVRQSDVEIDFKNMNVFLIEREFSLLDNTPITNLGYKLPNGKIGEWSIQCSDETHARLVNQFRQYLKDSSKDEL